MRNANSSLFVNVNVSEEQELLFILGGLEALQVKAKKARRRLFNRLETLQARMDEAKRLIKRSASLSEKEAESLRISKQAINDGLQGIMEDVDRLVHETSGWHEAIQLQSDLFRLAEGLMEMTLSLSEPALRFNPVIKG